MQYLWVRPLYFLALHLVQSMWSRKQNRREPGNKVRVPRTVYLSHCFSGSYGSHRLAGKMCLLRSYQLLSTTFPAWDWVWYSVCMSVCVCNHTYPHTSTSYPPSHIHIITSSLTHPHHHLSPHLSRPWHHSRAARLHERQN